jgi:hypothetical protein
MSYCSACFLFGTRQVRRDLLLLQSLGLSHAVDTLVQLVTPDKLKTAPAKTASGNSMYTPSLHPFWSLLWP